jgi:type I restriction enzyme R subunit
VTCSVNGGDRNIIGCCRRWTKNATTQAEVKIFVLDNLYASLPRPFFSDEETEAIAERLYNFVWQQTEGEQLKAA